MGATCSLQVTRTYLGEIVDESNEAGFGDFLVIFCVANRGSHQLRRRRDSVSWHFVSLLAFLWGPSWVESDLAGKFGGVGVTKGWEDCLQPSYFV